MDPLLVFCHNPDCPARGQRRAGNIRIHSQKEQRYLCTTCGKPFAATKGTPFYRLATPPCWVTLAVTLLSCGCPPQAIVMAFGVEARTVARWQERAGAPCQHVHEHLVQQQGIDLGHVQADEMWVKLVGHRVWMAMAMAVPSRLWLGGVIGEARDGALIVALVKIVRSCAQRLSILVCVDGLASYVTAFVKEFRHPVRTGKVGRPPLEEEPGLLLGQVVKQYQKRRVTSVTTRVVRGTWKAIRTVLQATRTGNQIHTAYIERLNATFRGALCALARRSRRLLRREGMLGAGMYLVGCAYNFCWSHASLRLAAPLGAGRKWIERTPAMAAGLTDRCWTMAELLHYQVPLPVWEAPQRRRRPSRQDDASATGRNAKRSRGGVPAVGPAALPLAA